MDTNYIVAYNHEWNVLKTRDLHEVAKRRDAIYDEEKNQIKLRFLNNDYILDCNEETIAREKDGFVHSAETSVMILNYLGYNEIDAEKSNIWISMREIPNGGMRFYPAFYKNTILPLINKYGYDLKNFEQSCLELGGVPCDLGDKGFEIDVFPKVSLRVGVWEGDDELEPGVTVLFNKDVQNFMHVEAAIGMGMYIGKRILKKEVSGIL